MMSRIQNDEIDIEKKKVIIIGGGPAGLTASYKLSEAGVESIVLEKESTVGGISKTVNYKDFYFDIGGHRFFTKIQAVEDMWRQVLGQDLIRRKRLSRIYYDRKFFYYPFRPLNAVFGLGIWRSLGIGASYAWTKIFPSRKEETLEEWVTNRFGRRLYRTFFKTYTEKVWGIPCSKIQAEWAAQRIKGLSLMTALKNALIRPNDGNGDKSKVVKTLIDEFDYPKYGPGMMWDKVAEEIESNGSQVWLSAEVVGILWENNRINGVEIIRDGQKETVSGTDFICSMPIREAIQRFKPGVSQEALDAGNALNYRDFLTVALIINQPDLFPDNWIYIHDENVKVGRIQNFKNWSPFMVPDSNKTCLGLEYFCFEGDSFWKMDDEKLIELAKGELEELGFVDKGDVVDGMVVRMPKAYPIYDSTYKKALGTIREFFNKIQNFYPIGRNGQHKYNNQDHSMLTGMMAAENVLGEKHDVWQVNIDGEYHEEITERILLRVFARIDKSAFATAFGTVGGAFLFLITIFSLLIGSGEMGNKLNLLNQYLTGYTVSLKGAFIGMAYGLFCGFLFGWLIAYLRNVLLWVFIHRIKKKAAISDFRDFLDSI